MLRISRLIIPLVAVLLVAYSIVIAQDDSAGGDTQPQVSLLIEGLRNPVNLAALPDGGLLIAEEGTGNDDLSAGVSLMTVDGEIGRLVSGLPSNRDSGDLSGVALVAVHPDGETIYIGNFAQRHLWTLAIPDDGFPQLPQTPFTPDDLGQTMQPFNNVVLTNPFDMTFDDDGVPIVADSSQNGVARELPDGRTQFFHRFSPLENPLNPDLTIDSVPTGIERYEDEYLVTLTGGCPYPAGGGELVAIDENRNQRTVVDNLNMPIDVALGEDGTLWLLEFARFREDGSCFSGGDYLPDTGRLSRVNADGTTETVVDNLNFPTSVLPLSDGSLYVTEIFDGEVLHITFGDSGAGDDDSAFTLPELDLASPQYNAIDDPDAALRAVIDQHNLTAYPGVDVREGDTDLAELGRDLFFDPILSGDQNISCATCHHPAFAMTDGRVLPVGTGGLGLGPHRDFTETIRLSAEYRGEGDPGVVANPANGIFVPRNSTTIINSALLPQQFWDGRVHAYALGAPVNSLESEVNRLGLTDVLVTQALFPIISRDEMAGATFGEEPPQYIRRTIAERLDANPEYSLRFRQIFDSDTITPLQIVEALAAFERQLIFTDSAWDDYIAGDLEALTDEQKRGALVFYGQLIEGVNCAGCHSGDMFSDMDFHNLLVPQLGPGKGNGINGREDWGHGNVSFDWRDRFTFRTSPLRNIELTAPYFHSGAYRTLEAVIWHHADIWAGAATYDPSAHLPQSFYSSLRPFDPDTTHTASPELAGGLPLTEGDVSDLVAFLRSLTDPAAADLMHLVPDSVPSGLALDPLPTEPVQLVSAAESLPQRVSVETVIEAQSDWHFRDVTGISGLDFTHGAFQFGLYDDPIAMMGAGLCWIDVDDDGWLDLYLVNSHSEDEYERLAIDGNLPRNALYRNVAGQFERVSASGTDLELRGNGCIAADFNVDGYDDLYITADGDDVLLLNRGNWTFERVDGHGIHAPEWNSAAAVADINGDGLPDLFIGSYIDLDHKIPNPFGAFPQDYYGLPDRLYLHQGVDANGVPQFVEVTRQVGLLREERTLGAIFSDADRDGDLDLYIANDGQPNRLYEYIPDDSNPHGFRYVDLTDTAEVGDAGSGMGVTSADYDNDGMFDLFVTNWEAELNALYRNETHEEGFINFRYSTYRIGMRGLGNDMTGWGTHWQDFDHDTDIDLVTVNGRVPVTNFTTDPEFVRFYGNRLVETGRPHFFEWTDRVRLKFVGTLLARGSAVADYDNDGDLDIAINVIGGRAVLLENASVEGNWLMVDMPDMLPGTVVEVMLPDDRVLLRERHLGSSYLASEDPRLHFGLGDAENIPRLRVLYRGEVLTELTDVAVNQHLTITAP